VSDTANDRLFSAAVRHQVQLLRFSNGEAERAIALLNQGDDELAKLLAGGLTEFQTGRSQGLLRSVRELRAALMDQLKGQLEERLSELAEIEANWEGKAIEAAIPFDFVTNSVPAQTLKGIVSRPINGINLDGWMNNVLERDVTRIGQAVNLGVLEGQTIDQIVRRVRGTKAAGYADGVVSMTRREATAVVRTAVNNTSNAARDEVWKANSDIVDGLRWTATLDGRTSDVCRARDGQVYEIGEGPRPPAHFQCRSLMVAVIDGIGVVGDRPDVRDTRTREARETDFRAEAKAAAGDKWKTMSAAERNAAIKARRQKWTEENIGQVPAKQTYDEWLRKQPNSFQDEVLGKEKGEMFRKGMTLDKFVDEKGRSYTLAELRARTAGDAMNVMQPGVGLKAKAYLQQGLATEQVLQMIKEEFPEANTSAASIASYKTELKKAGMLDELQGQGVKVGPAKWASTTKDQLDLFEGALPANLKSALGGQWATIADDLDGVPGAYAHYKAGKGVTFSAKKLSAVTTTQVQQVMAHELGHLLNKQHGLQIPFFDDAALKALASNISPDAKKLYSYYLSDIDELRAEIIAQALSPSPLTSQGLSAVQFRAVFGQAIEEAKQAIAQKWPTGVMPPVAPLPPSAVPGMVAGKHTDPKSLAKALWQQGLDEQDVLTAVKKEFGDEYGIIDTYSTADFFKDIDEWEAAKLKPSASGPVVTHTPAPSVAPPVPSPSIITNAPAPTTPIPAFADQYVEQLAKAGKSLDEVLAAVKKQFPTDVASWYGDAVIEVDYKKWAKAQTSPVAGPAPAASAPAAASPLAPSAVKVSASTLKEEGLNLFKSGVLGNDDVVQALKAKYPLNVDEIKYANVATWKSNWKKANPAEFTQAEQLAKGGAKVAAQSGPIAQPKLAGVQLGPNSSTALQELKQAIVAAGGNPVHLNDLDTILSKAFGAQWDMNKAQDLIDLAHYEVQTGQAVSKPYLNAVAQPKAPKLPVKTPLEQAEELVAQHNAKWIAAQKEIKEALDAAGHSATQKDAFETWANSMINHGDESIALAMLKSKYGVQGISDTTKALWDKLLPVHKQYVNSLSAASAAQTTVENLMKQAAKKATATAAAKAPKVDMTPTRVATTPREGYPPPPRFSEQQREAGVRKWAGRQYAQDASMLSDMNAVQQREGLELLTETESAAIRAYTRGVYRDLNQALRDGKYGAQFDLQAYTEAAQHGLRKMPKKPGLTSRGLTVYGNDLQKVLATYREGVIVEEAAFTSTTLGESAAFSGNVYMKIEGKTGVHVRDYSYHSRENEVLYAPGARFKVNRVENVNGKYVLYMEEVD
jgi:SPP1 gp7 family putative phage head morphogenesis protein